MSYPATSVTRQRPEFSMPFRQFAEMPDQFGHVGLKVLSPILVNLQSDVYYMETLKQEYQQGELLRSPGGGYNRVAKQFEEVTYRTRELGLEYRLDDRMLNAFSNMPQAEASAAQWLWRLIARGIEKELTDKLQDTAVITQTSGVTTTWNTHASSVPISDITTAAKAIHASTGLIADTVVFSYKQLLNLVNSNQVVDRIKYWGGQDPNPRALYASLETLAAALNVQRVLVAGLMTDTADKGQAISLASEWDDDKVGVYVTAPSGAGISEACIGRTPTWAGDGAGIGTGEDPQIMIESYREEQTRSEIYRSRAELDTDSALVLPTAGYILTGADA